MSARLIGICLTLNILSFFADIWAKTNKPFLAFIAWTINSAIWVWLYHKTNVGLATIGALYSIVCFVGTTCLGIWYFNENLTISVKIGLILGFLSISLISVGL